MKLQLLGMTAAALLVSSAAAESVTAAVRSEANALSRQYTGKVCRADYDLDTERYGRQLNTQQLKARRTAIYNDWKEDLAEDAREDGDTYKIGYENNRIWAWQKDRKGKTEFKVVTLSAAGERELSCDL
ncbi:hypothetical protein [Deinococcus sp. Marseille-Q6407]|uniref:hypothetical protein n=1 Tax=Deinococcus sp. Marseille-Q6407 TaxID=2969223 RepID=UPI0021C07790|nr:hypothetical protein [Deinococcus sp. Marseille-Q6407]